MENVFEIGFHSSFLSCIQSYLHTRSLNIIEYHSSFSRSTRSLGSLTVYILYQWYIEPVRNVRVASKLQCDLWMRLFLYKKQLLFSISFLVNDKKTMMLPIFSSVKHTKYCTSPFIFLGARERRVVKTWTNWWEKKQILHV